LGTGRPECTLLCLCFGALPLRSARPQWVRVPKSATFFIRFKFFDFQYYFFRRCSGRRSRGVLFKSGDCGSACYSRDAMKPCGRPAGGLASPRPAGRGLARGPAQIGAAPKETKYNMKQKIHVGMELHQSFCALQNHRDRTRNRQVIFNNYFVFSGASATL